jgi:hypothetical protein
MNKLPTAKLEELKNSFKGKIILPSDDAYESARKIWNATIDKHPSVPIIVRHQPHEKLL